DPVACSRSRALAALGVLGLHTAAAPLQGFSLWASMRQVARFGYRGERLTAAVETLDAGRFRVEVDGMLHE
ncbi:MAG: 3-methylcrotonyl-CoA carboxylase, partial [Rhodobacteraceae bacterium CG17_big_fil_post_rev_8_21_14_2_50_65_11]